MPSACTEVPIKRCKEPCKIVKTKKGKQCKTKYIQRKTAKGKKGSKESKGSKGSKGSNKTPKKKGSKGKKKGSKTKKQSALTEKAEEELQNKVEDTTTEENKEEQPTMMTDPVKTMINSAPESVTNLFNTSTEQPTDVTTEVKEPEPVPETTPVPEEKVETSQVE